MKAVLLPKHGDAGVLEYGNTKEPELKPNHVLVQVKAASINHLDIWVRNGIPAYPVELPHILGADGAGIVKGLGQESEGVSEGDRVLVIPGLSCGDCLYCKRHQDNQCEKFEILGAKKKGTYGELALVPDESVIPLPDDLSFEEAAAFPLAYLTAWHMLITRAKLSLKDSVLIVGSSSGVAMAAIQIAKWKGAFVYAVTTDPSKEEKIRKAGADDVFISSPKNQFAKWIHEKTDKRGVDIVFEHVGPATWDSSVKSLARYGRLVTCGATTGPTVNMDLRYLFSKDISILGAKMGTRKEFKELTSLIFSHQIKPVIDHIFPIEEAAEAHRYLEARKQVGKVLLKHQ